MEVTYFTCTLGEAVNHQGGKSYSTINDFIKHKALSLPDVPVVGFYEVSDKTSSQWKPHVLTFEDIQRGTAITAEALSMKLHAGERQTVALLCHSSADFLFVWLALIYLGYPALLIAPQCSPSAIAQLCKACGVKYLVYDESYSDLAVKAAVEAVKPENHSLSTLLLPFTGQNIFEAIKRTSATSANGPVVLTDSDVAYLHHTSGTSSGTPKPIPQSHRGAIGVLPTLEGRRCASFTTTPLYHGGIADLFRAWTSNALIWLFPGREVPITAANIRKCLDVTSTWAEKTSGPEVKYFSSVPYVLQMLAEDNKGLEQLQRMDIVGVGGAALPSEVGQRLVKNSVNLISRFGSAECGFLMSSHRDYTKDKEWQYLRSTPGSNHLRFEPREGNLSELVIQNDWPHMAKRNRDDGSFATADLFAPHPTISNAWRYNSRSDSQLTLITGKKFDPAPLEDAIRASMSTVLEDVLIFGNGKPYSGAFLFRTEHAASISDEALVNKVAPVVGKLNRDSQSHARIARNMLIPIPHLRMKLEKSSKGTILRNKAQERFAEKIAAAYDQVMPDRDSSIDIPDTKVRETIRNTVLQVAGQSNPQEQGVGELTEEMDLFSYGVDSVACIQIRHALSRLVPHGTALPLTVVQDAGTISQLADLVLRIRSGESVDTTKSKERDEEEQHRLMLDLAKEYSVFNHPLARLSSSASSSLQQPHPGHAGTHVLLTGPTGSLGAHILLTGPTGSLGAHILSQLLPEPSVSRIHLLVRGATATACRERVLKALASRNLPIPATFDSKIQIHSCKLSGSALGLSTDVYESLAQNIDVIIHLAWSVNFLLPLRSFASTHLEGVRNLITFALSCERQRTPPRLIFCSSVAAVSNHSATAGSPSIPEQILAYPSASGSTGYARSKWVAEQLCAHAHGTTQLKDRISVARVGQLSGASDSGVWAASEAYPLMLGSVTVTGCLPDLDKARREQGVPSGEVLGWLPVNIAAEAFVEDILSKSDFSRNVPDAVDAERAERSNAKVNSQENGIPVHHILNPSKRVTWSHLLRWLSHQEEFKTVNVEEWLSRLEALQHSDDEWKRNHPALRLLGFWKDAYGSNGGETNAPPPTGMNEAEGGAISIDAGAEKVKESGMEQQQPNQQQSDYEMTETYASMPSLSAIDGVMNEEYVLKLWAWIKENV